MQYVCVQVLLLTDVYKESTTANVDTNRLYNFKITAKFVIH